MTITAEIVADSINEYGNRITTFKLRYPRFIHAEELTHRILDTQPDVIIYEAIPDGLMYDQDLSRNASSSRAIPVKKMIEDLRRDPAMPIYWGKNQAGMQAGEDWNSLVPVPTWSGGIQDVSREEAWFLAMEFNIRIAEGFVLSEYHKQIVNRLLEPWAHINVVVTATNWNNFFTLRRHKDAQPEIKLLADLIWDEMEKSNPELLVKGRWHLPFINNQDWINARDYLGISNYVDSRTDYTTLVDLLKKVSTARCARTSYLTFEGKTSSISEDIELHNKLVVSQPLHASPAEHQATPDKKNIIYHDTGVGGSEYSEDTGWMHPQLHGNLTGWIQYRKTLPGEYVEG